MTCPESEVLCPKYKLGFQVVVIYMYVMIDSLQSVFLYFILYNSDHRCVGVDLPLQIEILQLREVK